MFGRNIFIPLYLKAEGSSQAQLAITYGVTRWRHEGRYVISPGISYDVCNFLVEMSTFKQAIKLTFGRNNFGKKKLKNLQARIRFQKNSCVQIGKNIDQLHLLKKYPQCKFQIHITSRNVAMNKRSLRMHRCFRFRVQDCQNASIETWIKSKFQGSGIFLLSGMHGGEHCRSCRMYRSLKTWPLRSI